MQWRTSTSSRAARPARHRRDSTDKDNTSLKHLSYIELPDHMGTGGFDHAAVDRGRGLLYVAHTANDAIDVIETRSGKYLRSIPHLKGVAAAPVHEPSGLVFTSNRAENPTGPSSPSPPEPVTTA